MIGEVLSQSFSQYFVWFDVCYEWEAEIAKFFNAPIRSIAISDNHEPRTKWLRSFVKKVFPPAITIKHKIDAIKRKRKEHSMPELTQYINAPLTFCFLMIPSNMSLCVGGNCLPVFLDVWSKEQIKLIARCTKSMRLFYVTSMEIFKWIKDEAPSSNVRYMPLSIADKYFSENFAAYRNK